MSRANITDGIWTRHVPVKWRVSGSGRTDIFKRVLSDSRLRFARYVFSNGITVVIPAEELRRVLIEGKDRYAGKIWGPFNINPYEMTVNKVRVVMEIENSN